MQLFTILSPTGSLLPFLVSTIIQVTVLAAATLIASVLLRRRPAVVRHAVLLAGLVAVLLVPAALWWMNTTRTETINLRPVTASLGLHDFRLSDTWVLTQRTTSSANLQRPSPSSVPAANSAPTPDRGRQAERSSQANLTWVDDADSPSISMDTAVSLSAELLAAFWLLGVLAHGIGLVRGLAAARRLIGASRPNQNEALTSVYRETLELFSQRIHPRLLQSDAIPTPMVVGTFRPAIVLPRGIEQELSRAQLRDVLVHELAHVRRRDMWVGLLQRVTGILWWPHPLIHWLNRRLAQAREEICDNYGVTFGGKHEYARTLLQLSTRATPAEPLLATLGLLPPHWTLEDRIAGLLDGGRSLVLRLGRVRSLATAGIVGAGMLLFAGAAVMPDLTEEEAVRQIQRLGGSFSDLAGTPEGHEQVTIGNDWHGSGEALKQLKFIHGINEILFFGTKMDEVTLEDLPDLERIGFGFSEFDQFLGRQVVWNGPPARTIRLRNLPKMKLVDSVGETHLTTLELVKMDGLTTLQVTGLQLQDGILQSVSGAPNLTSITASRPFSTRPGGRTQITDAGLRSLHSLKVLADLNLDGARITNAGLKLIRELHSLKVLSLAASEITDDGLEYLAPLTELTALGVSETAITDMGLKRIVREHPKLKQIGLEGSAVTAAGLEELMRLPDLGSVSVDSSQLTEESCAVLSSLAIQTLRIDGSSQKPGRITGLHKLRRLFVEGAENLTITPGSLTGLMELYLRGAGANATRSCFEHFAQLQELEFLELRSGWTVAGALDDRPIHIDDQLIQHVARLKSLKVLCFEAPQVNVGDRGIAAISHLKLLDDVFLPKTNITDRGVASFEGLQNLKRLHLSGSGITNKALEHLRSLKQLSELILNNTGVDETFAEHFLAEYLPKAYIEAHKIEGVEVRP